MKKSMLYNGIGNIICGIALILFGKFGSFNSLIIGFGAGFITPGIMMIYKYIHWTKPQNIPIYEAKIKEEQISFKDERKIMLRDKSGRITYIIMLWLLLVLILIFSFMRIDKIVVIVLLGLWLFQYICGIVVFRYLDKKL